MNKPEHKAPTDRDSAKFTFETKPSSQSGRQYSDTLFLGPGGNLFTDALEILETKDARANYRLAKLITDVEEKLAQTTSLEEQIRRLFHEVIQQRPDSSLSSIEELSESDRAHYRDSIESIERSFKELQSALEDLEKAEAPQDTSRERHYDSRTG